MAMIAADEFRKGDAFRMGNQVMYVLESQTVKPGKGMTAVRVKARDVRAGKTEALQFRPSDEFERVAIDRRDAKFSNDNGDCLFVDTETYDLIPVKRGLPGSAFLKPETVCTLLSYEDSVFAVEIPEYMDFSVLRTEPFPAGDMRGAILETGVMIKVPADIQEGDIIRVDTRRGTYLGRAEQPAVEAPRFMDLSVVRMEPSPVGIMKRAILENGSVIEVPPFIQAGDIIKVDTQKGTYMSCVEK